MGFKMNAVIHRGNDYENSLRTFQNKRFGYLEQEIRAFDVETLRLTSIRPSKRGPHNRNTYRDGGIIRQ